MGKLYSAITEDIQAWIGQQQMFFVATAPTAGSHINCSPKGINSLRVLGPRELAYLDLTGSGVETIAHLKENGRIVIMLCALAGAPKIMRFHGTGDAYGPGSPEFERYHRHFATTPGERAIIHIQVERISDSCGQGVPLYAYQGQRQELLQWAAAKGESGLQQYRQQKNHHSIDQLPGLE